MKVTELADELEVSERQIKTYRNALEEAGIFILSKSGINGGYELSSRGNLLGISLSVEELSLLDMIGSELKYSDNMYYKEFTHIIDKLKAVKCNNNVNIENVEYYAVQLRENCNYKEEKIKYESLNEAYITSHKVAIEYFSISSGVSSRVIHPYGLYTYKNANYVVAFCEKRNEIRDFKLCRIRKYEVIKEKFEKDRAFQWERYVENCIGIWKGKEKKIKLEIQYPYAEIIKEKIWVESQIIEDTKNNSIIFTANIMDSPELRSWILGMGRFVKVLEPDTLRESILKEINMMIDNI